MRHGTEEMKAINHKGTKKNRKDMSPQMKRMNTDKG
jgi:hypothetical protein